MKYLPQAPPFVMIDQLVTHDGEQTITNYTVKDRNIFVQNGVFTEPGLIENMAQTAAAGMGYVAVNNHRRPEVGFIGQITNLEIHLLPPVDATLKTTVRLTHRILNVLLVEGAISWRGNPVAAASFKVFLQE